MRNLNAKLEQYKPFVNFIADIIGEQCEVILHDVSDPNHSIIAMANGHISGRKIGDPMTDLALRIVSEKTYLNKDYLTNYNSTVRNEKILRSSVYFIKNEEEALIGLLCINVDVSQLLKVQDYINQFFPRTSIPSSSEKKDRAEEEITENLENNLTQILSSLIEEGRMELQHTTNMSVDDKIRIVKKLDEKGVFLLKGGVTEAAKLLEVSEPSIYRYLKQIK